MITQSLDWSVGYTTDPCIAPKEFYNAAVPGSVQSDYAKAMHLPPYQYETNFSEYDWMEDMYWIYNTTDVCLLSPDPPFCNALSFPEIGQSVYFAYSGMLKYIDDPEIHLSTYVF